MSRPRVMICGDLVWAHDECKEILATIADVIRMDSPSRDDFVAGFKPGGKYDGVVGMYRHNMCTGRIGLFDVDLIAAFPPYFKWIAHNGAGYDQIDILECKKKGIIVSNTPGAVDDATATTALYLLISALRQYSRAEQSIRSLNWKNGLPPAHDITSKTLAILGMGGIGLRLAHLVHAFPMRVIYHNRKKRDDVPEWCEYYGQEKLKDFLAEADVLSVHVPLRKETEGFVGEEMIRGLKKGAIIVNTARGKVIDEDAMIRALEDGHLSAVGLDVFPDEPEVNSKWFSLPQATLLPHMGTETEESQRAMEVRAMNNLREYLLTGMGTDLVPEYGDLKLKHNAHM